MPAYLAGIKGEKRMRILHTGDWHLGRTLEGRSRLIEQEAFLDELEFTLNKKVIDSAFALFDKDKVRRIPFAVAVLLRCRL